MLPKNKSCMTVALWSLAVLESILSMGRTVRSLPWLDQASADVHVAYLPIHDICSFPS